jgi:hypothetical protein
MSPSMKLKRAHCCGVTASLDLMQVVPMTGGEVVQPDHVLVVFEQLLQQVAADETGDAGDQPGFRLAGQSGE